MEKDQQPDSLTDVTVKQYAPSEVYSTEPPPAYVRPQSSAVQVARIAAITLVAMSVVLGGFILAAAYVNANASCAHLEQELQMLQRTDNYLSASQPEALVQDVPIEHRMLKEHATHAETKMEPNRDEDQDTKDIDGNNVDSSENDDEENSEEDEDRTRIHIKLPLQLDFDEIAGALMEKNQRSRMNCVVEKKRAEEVIDHQPKTLRLPFGLNLTTDPRYERVTGERMAIFCESGEDQRQQPQENQPQQQEEEEETLMIQPIIVPLPDPSQFQRQMPPQMHPQMMPHPQLMSQHPQIINAHPQMRPEMHVITENQLRGEEAQIEQRMRAHAMMIQQQQLQQQQQQHEERRQQQMQAGGPSSGQLLHPLMQHIAQQIIAQHEMAAARERDEAQHQQNHQQQQQMTHHIPIPEEVLTQINRLPNQEVTVSVTEHETEEVPQGTVRIVQHPRESAHEMNGRQTYGRTLPVNIPVPMMQHVQQPTEAEHEQARPHYVQPRSIRSVDKLLHREKRVKRSCSCDCAC